MSDENTVTDDGQGGEGGTQGELVPKSELTNVISQRQKEKEKRRALEQSNAELSAKIAEFESAQTAAEEERLRQQGENEKIIASRDEALANVTAELEQMKWGQRFNTTVQAVTAASGLDAAIVEGLLLREKQVRGTDVAPQELSDDGVAELVDAMRASAPSLFETRNVGGTPGAATGAGGVTETQQRAHRMGAHHIRK